MFRSMVSQTGGLVGSCFNYLHVALVVWRKRALAPWGPRGRVVEAVVVAALVSGVSFFLPLMVECQVGYLLKWAGC